MEDYCDFAVTWGNYFADVIDNAPKDSTARHVTKTE